MGPPQVQWRIIYDISSLAVITSYYTDKYLEKKYPSTVTDSSVFPPPPYSAVAPNHTTAASRWHPQKTSTTESGDKTATIGEWDGGRLDLENRFVTALLPPPSSGVRPSPAGSCCYIRQTRQLANYEDFRSFRRSASERMPVTVLVASACL